MACDMCTIVTSVQLKSGPFMNLLTSNKTWSQSFSIYISYFSFLERKNWTWIYKYILLYVHIKSTSITPLRQRQEPFLQRWQVLVPSTSPTGCLCLENGNLTPNGKNWSYGESPWNIDNIELCQWSFWGELLNSWVYFQTCFIFTPFAEDFPFSLQWNWNHQLEFPWPYMDPMRFLIHVIAWYISYNLFSWLKTSFQENSNRPLQHTPDPQLPVYERNPFTFVFLFTWGFCSRASVVQLSWDHLKFSCGGVLPIFSPQLPPWLVLVQGIIGVAFARLLWYLQDSKGAMRFFMVVVGWWVVYFFSL